MFTSAESRERAEQKLAQADGDSRNRKRLITAAEGWLLLASQMRRLEVAFENDEVVPEGRPTTRVETKALKTT